MTSSVYDIVFNLIKKGQGDKEAAASVKNLGKGFNDLVKGVTGFNVGALTAAGAMVAIANGVKKAVNEWQAYAGQMEDGSRLTGMAIDQYSRVVQVADDAKISINTLDTAFTFAAKNGIKITTESLKTMSDEYLALEPGQERANYLIEKFGKQGADLGKMFEQGSAGMQAAFDTVADGLIVTEEQRIESEKLRLAQDSLADSMQGVKNSVARWLVPGLAAGAEAIVKLLNRGQELKSLFAEQSRENMNSKQSWEDYARGLVEVGMETGQLHEMNARMGQSLLDGKIRAEDYDRILLELVTELGGVDETTRNAILAQEGMNEMLEEGIPYFGALSATLPGVVSGMEELATPTWNVSSAFEELNRQQIYNIAAEDLSREAQLSLAREMGLLNETAYAQLTFLDELKTAYKNGEISADEYELAVANLDTSIKQLSDKKVTLTVDNVIRYTYEMHGNPPMGGTMGGGTGEANQSYQMQASGGPEYAGQGYLVGEYGPEFFRPHQNGYMLTADQTESVSKPGGDVNIYWYGDVRSEMDIEMTARRFAEMRQRRA